VFDREEKKWSERGNADKKNASSHKNTILEKYWNCSSFSLFLYLFNISTKNWGDLSWALQLSISQNVTEL